ncbi:MAG TPA: DUF1207 domain-containing protein [Longimicrobiales bacterium]|nr:DUF1207 domain-containing protein [Longimicrobiales bacterium]
MTRFRLPAREDARASGGAEERMVLRRRRKMGLVLIPVLVLVLMLVPAAVQAQSDVILPRVRYFRTPIADPAATRISVGLLATNLLAQQGDERPEFTLPDAEDSAHDVVAAVSVGAVFPLLHVAQWPGGGVTLVSEFKVFSRFRIEYPSRDDMGQDWYVGGGVEARRNEWSGRAAIIHRSSHMGDEFALQTGAQRIEFGSEQLDITAAYDVPGMLRTYGGVTWIFRSYLSWEPLLDGLNIRDRAVVQLGADREWQPFTNRLVALYAGVDAHAAERTDWDVGIAAAAGIGVHNERSLRLMLRAYNGPSMMGEFFRTSERYYALELVAEF